MELAPLPTEDSSHPWTLYLAPSETLRMVRRRLLRVLSVEAPIVDSGTGGAKALRAPRCRGVGTLIWVAVKELNLSYCSGETHLPYIPIMVT